MEDPTTTAGFQLKISKCKFASFSGEGESSESIINWLHDFTSTPLSSSPKLIVDTTPVVLDLGSIPPPTQTFKFEVFF